MDQMEFKANIGFRVSFAEIQGSCDGEHVSLCEMECDCYGQISHRKKVVVSSQVSRMSFSDLLDPRSMFTSLGRWGVYL